MKILHDLSLSCEFIKKTKAYNYAVRKTELLYMEEVVKTIIYIILYSIEFYILIYSAIKNIYQV